MDRAIAILLINCELLGCDEDDAGDDAADNAADWGRPRDRELAEYRHRG